MQKQIPPHSQAAGEDVSSNSETGRERAFGDVGVVGSAGASRGEASNRGDRRMGERVGDAVGVATLILCAKWMQVSDESDGSLRCGIRLPRDFCAL